jgi:hypothetical protein
MHVVQARRYRWLTKKHLQGAAEQRDCGYEEKADLNDSFTDGQGICAHDPYL